MNHFSQVTLKRERSEPRGSRGGRHGEVRARSARLEPRPPSSPDDGRWPAVPRGSALRASRLGMTTICFNLVPPVSDDVPQRAEVRQANPSDPPTPRIWLRAE